MSSKYLNHSYIEGKVYFIILFFLLCVFFVSPIFSFFIIIALFSLVKVDSIFLRLPLVILMIASGAAIYASRFVHPLGLIGDDFYSEYYPLFQSVSHGEGVFSSGFGGGAEFGLAVIYKIISIFLPGADYWQLLFITSFFCAIIYYVWLERFILSRLEGKDLTLCLASAFLFFGFFVTTQLIRQAISSIFVLYTISYYKDCQYKKAFLACFIGSVFHITAIPISFLFYNLMYGSKKRKLIIVIFFVLFALFFSLFINFVASGALFSVLASKFLYYSYDSTSGFSTAYYWKILIFILMISLFFYIRDGWSEYKSLLIYGIMVYFCLINIQFASDRTLMPFVVYILGVVVFFSFYKIRKIYSCIIILLCIFRVITLGPMYNFNCQEQALCLWSSYTWLGPIFK